MTTSPPKLGALARARGAGRAAPTGSVPATAPGPALDGGGSGGPPAGDAGPAPAPKADPAGSPKPRPRRSRRVLREVGLACIAAGAVVWLFAGYQLVGTGIAEARSQQQLKQQFDRPVDPPAPRAPAVAVTTPPTSVALPAAPSGQAVAHLVIPRIGVDKFVVAGVGVSDLRKGPGHYPGTPLPGQPGNAAIAGHRTTYGAPFYRLNELRPGDDIYVTTRQGQFVYTVFQTEVVKPTDVSVLDPTPDNRLTLTTCNPRFSAATRLVVVSRLTELPAPAPAPVVAAATPAAAAGGTPTLPGDTAPAAANLGAGDNSAWPPALLLGALTILVWVGVRVRSARAAAGRRLRPYLVGVPLCLLLLWFLFGSVIRLLPANI